MKKYCFYCGMTESDHAGDDHGFQARVSSCLTEEEADKLASLDHKLYLIYREYHKIKRREIEFEKNRKKQAEI